MVEYYTSIMYNYKEFENQCPHSGKRHWTKGGRVCKIGLETGNAEKRMNIEKTGKCIERNTGK